MSVKNDYTGKPFMTARECMEVANRDFPEFNRNEKEKIATLIQRRSFLQSSQLTDQKRKEIGAITWALKEINDFVDNETEDEE